MYYGGSDGVWYKEFLKIGSKFGVVGDPVTDVAAIQIHIPTRGMVAP